MKRKITVTLTIDDADQFAEQWGVKDWQEDRERIMKAIMAEVKQGAAKNLEVPAYRIAVSAELEEVDGRVRKSFNIF